MNELFAFVCYGIAQINAGIIVTATTALLSISNSIAWITNRNPATDFLTDAVAVEAALLGLTVPLSFEIISRISERYNSDVVTRQFVEEPVVRWMPHCLVANICLAIVMKFLKRPQDGGNGWLCLSWLGLLGFAFTSWMLFRFLATLRKYVVNRQFLMDSLFNVAHDSLE